MVNAAGRRPTLIALAPQWNGGGRRADIPENIWLIFLGAQLQKPVAARSYRLAKAAADANGVEIPHCKTFERRFKQVAGEALRKSLTIEGSVAA